RGGHAFGLDRPGAGSRRTDGRGRGRLVRPDRRGSARSQPAGRLFRLRRAWGYADVLGRGGAADRGGGDGGHEIGERGLMSSHKEEPVKRLHAPDILARKGGEPIVCLTAYDAPTAEMLDEHCDLLLVGDSVGMVVHGLPNTVGVTLDMMILHGQAVMRGARRAMVVIDMPFGSYEGGREVAYENCAR